ncbi:hypothetical protein RhiJN_03776 [Ceratobasidium sp. AG-Ba]|nr:hypothetical protein RhiJN_03776 [Ceratobasidium sp. AG-Ba]
MATTKANREKFARTKKVKAQEAAIVAKEQGSDDEEDNEEDEESMEDDGDDYDHEDDEDDEGDEDDEDDEDDELADDGENDRGDSVSKPKAKSQAKGKGKAVPAKKVDPERQSLLDRISVLFKTPKKELELFGTDQLKELWKLKLVEKATEGVAQSGAKPKPKVRPATTPKPKKVKASPVMESSITMVGSPVLALKAGQALTAKAMASPLRRKRSASTDLGHPDAKRSNLDEKGTLSKPALAPGTKQALAKSQSSNSRASSAVPSATAPSSRAADLSRASSRVPSRASSIAPNATLTASGSSSLSLPAAPASTRLATKSPLPPIQDINSDSEVEEPRLGDGALDEYCDERNFGELQEPVPVPAAKSPMKKKRRSKKKGLDDGDENKRERPSTSQFEGVEREIVDRAVECTLFVQAVEGFYCSAETSLLMIHRGWEMAVFHYDEDPDKWPINQDHITVIRSRTSSFRSRGRGRINYAFRNIYNLVITRENPIEQVKATAKSLYPIEFHRDAHSKRGGHYRRAFLAEAVYLVFYTGDKPVGVRFAEELPQPTISMVALVCTMIEDLLMRYGRDGNYIKEEKGAKRNKEGANNTRSTSKELTAIFTRHFGNLTTFKNEKKEKFAPWMDAFAASVVACSGKKAPTARRKSQLELGVLDASAFDSDDDDDDAPVEPIQPKSPASARRAPRPQPRNIEQEADSRSLTIGDTNGRPDDKEIAELPQLPEPDNLDEEMGEVEVAPPAKMDGRTYQPLDNHEGRAATDDEMADVGGMGDAQHTGPASSDSTRGEPEKADLPERQAVSMDDDGPLTDLDGDDGAPPAPDTNKPDPSALAMERFLAKLKAERDAATALQEQRVKKPGPGRKRKTAEEDEEEASEPKPKPKRAAKKKRRGKTDKDEADEGADVGQESSQAQNAPKVATRTSARRAGVTAGN